MTSKERVHAALEGRPVDRTPATTLYNYLYHGDHFAELTGRPPWELWMWKYADPDEHLETYKAIVQAAPFETLQPQPAPSREAREHTEFVEREGEVFLHHRKRDTFTSLRAVSGHAFDQVANQTQYVFDREDVDERVRIIKAEDLIAAGYNDYVEAAVAVLGRDHFILAGGVTGTLWSCHSYVGQLNLFAMLIEEPDLIEYLSQRILEQHIETIRQLAAAGGDALYIDDALATCDLISVEHYERFCRPYVQEMIQEIHRLGQKAILIYFGGIADRLEQVASLGADGLSVECSMKGYVNDLGAIAAAMGDHVSLFGNVDPVGVLQNGTDAELEAEMKRQAEAGRLARGFIACTGSPITPATPLARVRRFLELGRRS
jgi:uroporphyrinogen-III decarboxylase